jgi:hypothetical protein
MAESCGEPYDSSDEYDRDERIETIYQGWGAREMAERIVDLEDEIGADVDGICTGMHADVAEAHAAWEDIRDERDRYRSAWRSARRRAFLTGLRLELAEQSRERRTAWLVRAVEHAGTHRRHRDHYRLAWLSARRRAADEANMGLEAVDHIRKDRDRWRSGHETAEAQLVRERRENARLRAFADEVKQVHGRCRDGEPDCADRFLRDVYDSMYELWNAEREKRQFVERVHRRAARGEFDNVAEEESRETTDAPRLECVGTEEDGGTVWRLATGRQIR